MKRTVKDAIAIDLDPIDHLAERYLEAERTRELNAIYDSYDPTTESKSMEFDMTPSTPPTDPSTDAKLAAIARALGVDPTDTEGMRAAFEALIAPVALARRRALASMTAAERAKCIAAKVDPAKYAAIRAGIKARSK